MSLSAATVAKRKKDKQLDAISQEHQSTRERDDRLGTYAPEMGAEGLPYTEAWTQSDCETHEQTARRRKKENAQAVMIEETSMPAIKCSVCGIIQEPINWRHYGSHKPDWKDIRRYKTFDEITGART
jgi:hypothetical protein